MESAMGSLIVRNVEDEVIAHLKSRAAAHGRSAEAEHRDILRQALTPGSSHVPFGALRGQIYMAPDFDETDEELINIMRNGSI
jgi:plasmid stability protein